MLPARGKGRPGEQARLDLHGIEVLLEDIVRAEEIVASREAKGGERRVVADGDRIDQSRLSGPLSS